jgi:hypothetical protein
MMGCLFPGTEMSTRCLWHMEALGLEPLPYYIASVRTSFCLVAALGSIVVHLPVCPLVPLPRATPKNDRGRFRLSV